MNTAINKIAAKKILWLAVGFVLLINGFILGKAYVNRSQVVAQLQLSERELQLPPNYGFSKEDSSARVSLQWTTPNTEPIDITMNQWRWQYDRRLQLSNTHFLSFQFPDCAQKTRLRQKRSAWALLEFNGQSYAEYVAQIEQYHRLIMGLAPTQNTELSEKELAQKRKDADDFLTAAKKTHSRLFVVDAASERGLLEAAQRKHLTTANSQLFIVPAELRASGYRCDKNDERTTEVSIENLAVESLYIPRHFVHHFPQDHDAQRKSKFTIEISYGRFFEPWVSDFTSTIL